MEPFQYPSRRHHRRHGPRGYRAASEFLPWLRDEFSFRCVFCLEREQWVNTIGHFHVDHFAPTSLSPESEHLYENLLFACHSCNALKGKLVVPDPLEFLRSKSVVIGKDGSIRGLTKDAKRLITLLKLDLPSYCRRRKMVIEIVALAKEHQPALYRELMAYPETVPDLSRLKPPGGNSKPSGLANSAFARRKRRELPERY